MGLKDVIGQDRAISILLGTLKRERIPSAYLFAGESGIGKKFTAINLAKTLNCQNRIEFDACDECSSCRKIDAQTHPDFLLIAPEKGEIRIEEIRAIDEALSFAPYEGKRKVVIVDDAETMNSSAANAFLKTLEEPPPQSLIILISASPDRLTETILSRCSRITFLPLSAEKCEEAIQTVVRRQALGISQKGSRKISETLKTEDYRLSTVARLSMGRPGLAISNDLSEERDQSIKLLSEMLFERNKEIWADNDEIEKWFNTVFTILRDIAIFQITEKDNMLINIDLKDKIASAGKTIKLKDITETYIRLSFLKGYLEFNLNKSITWNYVSSIMKGLGIGRL